MEVSTRHVKILLTGFGKSMVLPFIREFDDLAESIAEPPQNRPIEKAIGEFGRTVCDRISANPQIYAPTILQSPLRAACQPYWDANNYDGPELVLPFTGGQCAGVPYGARYTYRQGVGGSPINYTPSSGQFFNFNQTAYGPISVIGVLGPGASTFCGNPGQGSFEFNGFTSAGVPRRFALNLAGSPCRTASGIIIEGLSFERLTAGSECGDPPGTYEPGPNPAPDPGPLPPGTGPQLDVRGNVVLVLPGAIQISPEFTLELAPGEINIGGAGGTGAPAVEPLAGDETEGDGSGVGGGDNDFGDPPEGERWVGCCVTITDRPQGSGSIPQSEPQTIYPAIVGNVRLRFKADSEASEYDTPLQNRQRTTCVWEPVRGLKPVGVRVNLLPGFEYTFRPYSVPLEQ